MGSIRSLYVDIRCRWFPDVQAGTTPGDQGAMSLKKQRRRSRECLYEVRPHLLTGRALRSSVPRERAHRKEFGVRARCRVLRVCFGGFCFPLPKDNPLNRRIVSSASIHVCVARNAAKNSHSGRTSFSGQDQPAAALLHRSGNSSQPRPHGAFTVLERPAATCLRPRRFQSVRERRGCVLYPATKAPFFRQVGPLSRPDLRSRCADDGASVGSLNQGRDKARVPCYPAVKCQMFLVLW